MQRIKKLCLKILRCAVLGVLVLFGVGFTYGCLRGPYYSQKYSGVRGQVKPIRLERALTPIEQAEGHTCGLLALSSLYLAYGLDPAGANLRFRLGVDQTAVPLADGTEGTLHPDLFRVANQDGFEIHILDPANPAARRELLAHLTENAALALIPVGGGLHWIAIDKGGDYGELRVSDSLESESYLVEAETLLATPILSLLLFTPSTRTQTINESHAQGMAEIARVYARMRE